ncbi:hypothetical protein M758_5G024100 [Ceratodon purpureus]|nr:hypothetical protein M758_5G024100 [Ceratodon purpureus]
MQKDHILLAIEARSSEHIWILELAGILDLVPHASIMLWIARGLNLLRTRDLCEIRLQSDTLQLPICSSVNLMCIQREDQWLRKDALSAYY